MVPEGVDPLLVEDDEPLALVVAAHLALELDHLLDPVIGECTFMYVYSSTSIKNIMNS